MKCNCSKWDDESPCPIHNPKLEQPEQVEHETYVIRVYRRRYNKKWFWTVAKDAILMSMSDDLDTKPKLEFRAIEPAAKPHPPPDQA